MQRKEKYFGEQAIKPSFSQPQKSNSTPSQSLQNLENSASRHLDATPTSFYHPTTKVSNKLHNKIRKSQVSTNSSKKSNKGPFAVIITILVATIAIFFGSFSLLGAHLQTVFTEVTDSQYTDYVMRNKRLISYMLDGGDKIKTTWSGARKYNTFTPYMQSRLAAQGITVGTLDADGNFVKGDNLTAGTSRVLQYDNKIITADNFTAKYAEDANFRSAYTKARLGRAATMLDSTALSYYHKKGLNLDLFDDYKTTGDDATDTENYREIMTDAFDGDTSTRINTASDQTTTDEDGQTSTEVTANGDDASSSGSTTDATERARSYIASVGSKASGSLSVGCAALQVGSLISTAVAANTFYQAIHYYINLTENFSKMMAGDGNESAISQVLNFFTTSTTSEVTDISTGTTTKVTGSPLESEGAGLILADAQPSSSVQNYSLTSLTSSITTAIAMTGTSVATCNVANTATALVSLSTSAVPGGSFVKLMTGALVQTVAGTAIQLTITGILSVAIPQVAKTLFTNTFESYTGIPAGNLYSLGSSANSNLLAQQGSGLGVASKEAILAEQPITNAIIAEDAEVDRLNHSPIDPTSENTFLGSIATSLASIIATNSSLLSGFANLLNNSLTSNIFAEGENTSYRTTFGDNCNDDGLAYDIYCIAETASDPSTYDIAPDDATYQQVLSSSLYWDDDGTEHIRDGSPLAEYIVYYVNRESPVGMYDANIASACEASLGVVGDNLPVIGDVVALVNVAQSGDCADKATGVRYANSADNPYWDSEIKYYARYVADNRYLLQMGAFEDTTDPVTAFTNQYYAENPLDNSETGYLARISGLSTDDAQLALDLIDYYALLADYDPESAYDFTQSRELPTVTISENNSPNFTNIIALLLPPITTTQRQITEVTV